MNKSLVQDRNEIVAWDSLARRQVDFYLVQRRTLRTRTFGSERIFERTSSITSLLKNSEIADAPKS